MPREPKFIRIIDGTGGLMCAKGELKVGTKSSPCVLVLESRTLGIEDTAHLRTRTSRSDR